MKDGLEKIRIMSPYASIFANYTKKPSFKPFKELW